MRKALTRARAFLLRRTVGQWALEIAGVSLVAIAASTLAIGFGLTVAGLYLVMVANTGGSNAGSR